MDEFLEKTADEAFELHSDKSTSPQSEDDPETLYDKLLKLRSQIDRVNSLLLQSLTLQNKSRDLVLVARDAFEYAWNKEAAAGNSPEYSSAKEREARYTLAALDLKISLRKFERVLANLDYLVDYLKTAQRGMDGRRRDIDALVRSKAAAMSLER